MDKLIKICSRCKLEGEFTKSKSTYDGLQSACKECKKKDREKRKDIQKEYIKKYFNKNKIGIRSKRKQWYQDNKEYVNTQSKIYQNNHKEQHQKSVNKYSRKRYKIDPVYRLSILLRNNFYQAITNDGNKKFISAIKLLGCSIEEFKNYISKKFRSEMTWENYEKIWEIDHILPCVSFDLTKEEEQKKCFHFSNMQPLFKTTEIAKSFGYKNEIGNRNKYNKIINGK